MKHLDAIETVLRAAAEPMSAKAIADEAIRRGLITEYGKTLHSSLNRDLNQDIAKGGSRFVKCGKGLFAVKGAVSGHRVAKKAMPKKTKKVGMRDFGYVYILTNPSFRKDWVKIGMTERPVNTRSKELDNTAVPLPFEIYATLRTEHRAKIEKLLHGFIDEIDPKMRIRKTREFFNIQPETALRLLIKAAEVFDEEKNISEEFRRAGDKAKETVGVKRSRQTKRVTKSQKESWSGKTQLAKLIARRGGNEGAFGGILHFFSRLRPCVKESKWRAALEAAGVTFDAKDFVKDWASARNPL